MDQSKKRMENLIICIVDLAAVLLSYGVAGLIWLTAYMNLSDFYYLNYILGHDLPMILLAYLILIIIGNENKNFSKRDVVDELIVAFKSNVIFGAVLSVILLMRKSSTILPRGIFILVIVLNIFFMFALHCLTRNYLMNIRRKKKYVNKVLVITMRDRVDDIMKSDRRNKEWHSRVDGIILVDDDCSGEKIYGVPVVATYSDMMEYLKRQIVDEVFISLPYDSGKSIARVVEEMEDMGIVVHLQIDKLLEYSEFNKTLGMFGEIPVVTLANVFHNQEQLLLKRVIDIIGSLIGLVLTGVVTVFLAPVLLIESPGPLIFKQKRVGINGRYFYMYKFRSMYKDAEERKKELMDKNEMNGLMFKMTDDPRITKVGKFIRKTSIDELPQFLNVLKGDMSLVGTRPPTVDEFKQYEGHHKRRLSMKPGITGMWQVSGRSDIEDFEEVVRLDLEYIDNWSIWLDMKILMKTVGAVFANKGAK